VFVATADLRRFGRKLRAPLAEAAQQRREFLERRRALVRGTRSGLQAAAVDLQRQLSMGRGRGAGAAASALLPLKESEPWGAAAPLTPWDVRSMRQLVPTPQAPSLVEIAAGGRPFPEALLSATEAPHRATTSTVTTGVSGGLPPGITPGGNWEWPAAAQGGLMGAVWASSAGSSSAPWQLEDSPPPSADLMALAVQSPPAQQPDTPAATGAAAPRQQQQQAVAAAVQGKQQSGATEQREQPQARRQQSIGREPPAAGRRRLGGGFVASYATKRLADEGSSHAAVVLQLAAVQAHQRRV
jgi:hypothetical protein